MKILVTGSAGYIGSNLSEYLLNNGYDVVGVDNFNDYYDPKIKEYNIRDFKENPHFKLYRSDLLDQEKLNEIFINEGEIDAIVHLAAWAGVTSSIELPVVYVRNNIEATINLLELCKKHGTDNFIFASTSSVYGNNPTPFTEEMSTDLPLAPYPATKKACEVLLYTYAVNAGINTSILRIFNPNGIRMRPDLALPILIKSCLYGKEFKMYWTEEDAKKSGRDYVYLGHILDTIDYLIKNPQKYEIYNMGNSSPVTLWELIKTVEKVTGKNANIKQMPPRQGEMFMTYANVEKAKRQIGFSPVKTIEEIVEIYLNWFNQQTDWYKSL